MISPRIISIRTALATAIVSSALQASTIPAPITSPGTARLQSTTANGLSGGPCFSGDGRFLFFSSTARNLVTNEPATSTMELFRRELATGLVSRVPAKVGGAMVVLNSSHDGSSLLIRSGTVGEPDRGLQLYRLDTASGESTAVNVLPDGTIANTPCTEGIMTPNGRWIVFETSADRLVPEDSNSVADIYLWDTQTQTRRRVTEIPVAIRLGNPDLIGISDDGRILAYALPVSSPLLTTDSTRETDIVVVDLVADSARRLTAALGTTATTLPGTTINRTLSHDGRFLAARLERLPGQETLVTNAAGTAGVVWWDLAAGTSSIGDTGQPGRQGYRLLHEGTGPTMAPDGRTLAFGFFNSTNPTAPMELRIWSPETGRKTPGDLAIAVPPAEVTADPLAVDEITWTPDGQAVLFTAGTPTNSALRTLYRRTLSTGHTEVVSHKPTGEASEISSAYPTLSPDGRWTAFVSDAADLVAGDANRAGDLFLSDRTTGAVSIAGPSVPGVSAPFVTGHQGLGPKALSSDGQWLLFTSTSKDWVTNDTNADSDIYLRDQASGEISLVSVGTNGFAGAGSSFAPILSGNGRAAVFFSRAPGLTPGTNGAGLPAYHRDLATGRTQRINRRAGTDDGANVDIVSPAMSDDGRWVAYYARSLSDLILPSPEALNGAVYLFDAQSGENRLLGKFPTSSPSVSFGIQISANGDVVAVGNGRGSLSELALLKTGDPGGSRIFQTNFTAFALSPDGARIAFTPAPFGIPTAVYVQETFDGGSTLEIYQNAAARGFAGLQFTQDGRYVYCVTELTLTASSGASASEQELVMAPVTGGRRFEVVSTPLPGASLGSRVSQASASIDGRFVAFRSSATLVAGVTPGAHIYIRDRQRGITFVADPGAEVFAVGPQLSSDGRTLAFLSRARLDSRDALGFHDVFLGTIVDDPVSADRDEDGLPDEWEFFNFHTLAYGPGDDLDGDGVSNLRELRNGTSPVARPVTLSVGRRVDGGGAWLRTELTPEVNTGLRLYGRTTPETSWLPLRSMLLPKGQRIATEWPISAEAMSEFFKLELEQ